MGDAPSKTYRMIAIDLDGTLLSPRGEVSPQAKAAVHRALNAGLLVCFATGRNWTESRLVLEAVAHYPTAVFAGGAMIVDTHQKVVLHSMKMDPALAGEVCGFIESRGFAALALQDPESGVDYLVSATAEVDPMQTMGVQCTLWPDLSTHAHGHTVRVGMIGRIAETAKLHVEVTGHFGGRVMCHMIDFPGSGFAVLEVFDPSVNKWQGILKVAERHGINPEQIIAIGDDINDLAMIKNAGLGVAMGNARPEVQQIAKRVVGTNAEEGLAAFLDEVIDSGMVEKSNER
jgi:5-amino-6-(5-phospho-D-ribitylamino)uracil phosphatase